jgi:ABC-type xylose transport system substrate-binding protein
MPASAQNSNIIYFPHNCTKLIQNNETVINKTANATKSMALSPFTIRKHNMKEKGHAACFTRDE